MTHHGLHMALCWRTDDMPIYMAFFADDVVVRFTYQQTSQCISSVSFVRFDSNFFTIHRRQTQKMMDQNFEIRILWSLRIFWNFEKASRGPSAADLDHYGRCQTRSEWGPCDQVSSNRLTLKGRSASQRHKDRQTRLKWGPFRFAIGPTNWAQNNCPSGLQSGQKSAA